MLGSSYTDEEFKKYDIDGDGVINSKDQLMVRQLVKFNLKSSNPGKLLLDPTNWIRPIRIVNSSNQDVAWFGVNGAMTGDN